MPADRFADVDLPAVAARERRPEAVTDLVHHGRRQVAFGGGLPRLRRIHHAARQAAGSLRLTRASMKFLKKIFLVPFSCVDARVVRQVVGDRLVAVPQIAGAERRVHHLHRRGVAAHRRPIGGGQRQRVLNLGHPAAGRARGCGSPPRCGSARPRRTTFSRRADRRGRSRRARR